MLDERSPVPLYYQLQEIVRARIERGHWQPGQQLPSETELCKEFNLSRGTVRQALSELVREGMLHRRRGKGSFVARPKKAQDLMSASSFSSYARDVAGSELGNRLISVTLSRAAGPLAESLEIGEGSEVIEICKVKLNEGQPFFLVTSYLPRSAHPGLEAEDHSRGSLIDLLQDRYGIHVTRVKGWFEPVLVNEHEASLLEVEKGSPAMLYERLRYTDGDRPLMLSRHLIRGDMCRLAFQISY